MKSFRLSERYTLNLMAHGTAFLVGCSYWGGSDFGFYTVNLGFFAVQIARDEWRSLG